MQKTKLDILIERRDKLMEDAKPLIEEQKHLDDGTEARAYWHYGYAMAIDDILRNFELKPKDDSFYFGSGQITDHFEYLANPREDCRKELTEKLINDLSGEGNIIIYGNFEKAIIEKLVNLLPDLDISLNQILNRIVNFESIISKNFYHFDFHGSTSIKNTLPVLVPDMSYDELAIQEGDSAMAAFAYLALGKYKDDEINIYDQVVRKNT